MSVSSTSVIFKAFYNNGECISLNKQEYVNGDIFFWITESHLPYTLSVDSADSDISKISLFLKKRLNRYKNTIANTPDDEIEVINIYKNSVDVLERLSAFIDQQPTIRH